MCKYFIDLLANFCNCLRLDKPNISHQNDQIRQDGGPDDGQHGQINIETPVESDQHDQLVSRLNTRLGGLHHDHLNIGRHDSDIDQKNTCASEIDGDESSGHFPVDNSNTVNKKQANVETSGQLGSDSFDGSNYPTDYVGTEEDGHNVACGGLDTISEPSSDDTNSILNLVPLDDSESWHSDASSHESEDYGDILMNASLAQLQVRVVVSTLIEHIDNHVSDSDSDDEETSGIPYTDPPNVDDVSSVSDDGSFCVVVVECVGDSDGPGVPASQGSDQDSGQGSGQGSEGDDSTDETSLAYDIIPESNGNENYNAIRLLNDNVMDSSSDDNNDNQIRQHTPATSDSSTPMDGALVPVYHVTENEDGANDSDWGPDGDFQTNIIVVDGRQTQFNSDLVIREGSDDADQVVFIRALVDEIDMH